MAVVPALGLALGIAGCRSPAGDYDPEADMSQITETVGERVLDRPEGARVELAVQLRGRGRYPASWRSALVVSVKAREKEPDILGDTPRLVISPDLPARRSFEAERQHGSTARISEVNDFAAFDVPINELLYMADRSRGLELNGVPWDLTDAGRKAIRDAIVAAKQATDAGR